MPSSSNYYMTARHYVADARRAMRLAEEREINGRLEEATELRMWALYSVLEADSYRSRARALRDAQRDAA
jgi:hypothetical protein